MKPPVGGDAITFGTCQPATTTSTGTPRIRAKAVPDGSAEHRRRSGRTHPDAP